MAYNISGTLLTGGDTPEEPGNPRTFPEIYNALVTSLNTVLSEIDTDITNLQTQINDLQAQINTLNDDLQDYKVITDGRLDALESE